MPLCACGCACSTRSPRSPYASDRCRWRSKKRRARASRATALSHLELVTCAVCGRDLVRDGRTRSKRYHDECRPTAKKLLQNERQG